ncbi:hypothetical protein [Hydrogenophaga sp. BPS33]|uniref:hypothetical protein n=1 Tax=Hydrogenophaga sp. BPS33 TaxID=2651974 RepID=UPI00131FA218|nr:hypothetical protein [Hydrogenophaga sp. BPS33]QHE86373.1 hypothetical protein F9K07_16405 [Hydrogenophaga sp. BPS33]
MASQSNKISNKKPKLVRDSFTIPKAEFAAIDSLKTRAIALGTSVKKSELLRAGLMVLQGLNDAAYKAAVAAVPTLKTGRPSAAPQAKPASKAPAKPVAKAPVKAAAKPVAKPVSKTATKPVSKATTKPAAPKTAVAAPRPAAKRPAPSRRPAPAKKAA